jgi:hypothetical protein
MLATFVAKYVATVSEKRSKIELKNQSLVNLKNSFLWQVPHVMIQNALKEI